MQNRTIQQLHKGNAVGWVIGIVALVLLIVLGFGIFGGNKDTTPPQDDNNGGATGTTTVDVFLVRLEDGGENGEAIGCGDSLVAVEREIASTNATLEASLNELFSLQDGTITIDGVEYYNALHESNLSIDEGLSVSGGVATVPLKGDVKIGGVCDEPRFEEQLRETVLQFTTVTSADITINGVALEDYFDAQGQ